MRNIGTGESERPFAWLPFVLYLGFAVVVMVAVVLAFKAAGVSGGWIPFAVGGGLVGGLLSVVYPWLYDRAGPGERTP